MYARKHRSMVYPVLVPLVNYVVVVVDAISSCQSATVNWVKYHLLPGLCIVMFRLFHSLHKAAAFYCVILLISQCYRLLQLLFILLLMCVWRVSIKINYLPASEGDLGNFRSSLLPIGESLSIRPISVACAWSFGENMTSSIKTGST